MVIHPPTLFLGFASMVVPFAYGIAGLWQKKYKEWVKPAMPWALFAVMILGTGIIMGSFWAYEALNFGGSGGTPSLVECKVRASDKNQQYQFNSDGTISDVSKKMCFKSLAAKQPVTKDPNVPVEDNINGGNIALFPCSSSESSMKWKVENGIVSQDNGAGRMKCWHPENGNVAQDKKIQTWYCDEITPVKFEQYDYTG